jgi:hypothetical protein
MWWLVCGAAGVVGLLGGLAASPTGPVAALAISVGALGALTGAGCRLATETLPENIGRAMARSAGLGVVVILGFVLPFLVFGPVWFAGVLALCVTCPPSLRWCRSRCRGPSSFDQPTGIEAEQWAAWVMSGRALEHPLSAADAAVLVEVRQQVLDELVARHGTIPVELWSVGQAPPRAGDRGTGRA